MWNKRSHLLLSLLIMTAACGDDENTPGFDSLTQQQLQQVKETYAQTVYASYADALATAKALQQKVAAFVAAPSQSGLDAAKEAWKQAREPYGQTEAYRFYGGPIDDADNGPETRLNAWPMDEAYVDYVDGQADSGIINDATHYPDLTAKVLADANEGGGTDETAISTGYHAIEFLLWGQDLYDDSPGRRPWQDYLMGSEASAPNGDRRATYLSVVTQLLVDDLQTLVDAWAPDQDNYRNTFVGIDPREALRRMLTGMGVLSNGELAGQRMDVAMDTRDPEDEHSCFSDNTHRDIVNDAKGVQNVYLGRYGSNSGPGISALISQLDPTLDKSLRKELQTSVADAEDIPAPFDQAINEEDGRAKIQHTIDALREQSRSIVATAKLLEIDSLTTDIH